MSANHSLTFLFADDNDRDYEYLKCMLRSAPIVSLYRTTDGEETINYLKGEGEFGNRKRHPFPHVLILGLKLPIVSGFDVLQWLAKQKNVPARVCVMSFYHSKEDRQRAYQFGADDYFLQPLSLGHIAAIFGARGEFPRPNSIPVSLVTRKPFPALAGLGV